MARTDLTVTEIDRAGVDLEATYEAANADGEALLNNGATWVVVKNGNASTRTVTIKTNGRTVDGLTLPDDTVDVAQNEEMMIGPFERDTFNQKSGAVETGASDEGKVYLNFDAVTDLEICALRLSS